VARDEADLVGVVEPLVDAGPLSEPPRFFERSSVPTLTLYGPEDHVIWPDFPGALRGRLRGSRRAVGRAAGRSLPAVGAGRALRSATIAYLRDLLSGT
jgi:hypothetical protein